ncbi:extracellular solute-binding protein [Streptomyces sp. N2-109]|uniref:Extracellular solute-binding protein n=1 Tax=Streptomyces gossypii TaxID=2883101 RepID=A0ABT2JV89_9ACTN|nr:extracellular solute-binding protein [Streptomyces gossypii]MCT2591204.1 extracellular solute-binding protein [Streptomyces gossypii]
MSISLPSRRGVLGGLGALAVTGSFGLAAANRSASAIASDADVRVRYWNLFSGGDGANMIAMLDAFREENPRVEVKDSTLQWGSPYYTKLAMAAVGNRAPDLAVMHLGRIPGFAPGRLLDPWDLRLLAEYGVRKEDFDPLLWKRAVVDGKLYGLPLDVHTQLCFYRRDVCEKAGLLGEGGGLAAVTSPEDWFRALKAAKKAVKGGVHTIGIKANMPDFSWWFFLSFYTQLGGTVLSADGREVTFDTDKATQVLEFLRQHMTDGYTTPIGIADAESFVNGSAFTWEGNWSVPVFTGAKLDYGATPLPAVFGKPATHTESHCFVLPHQSERGGATNESAHQLAAYVIKNATDWALGGHIPAHLPTLKDKKYLALKPQSEYVSAMDHMAVEPSAWFSGSIGLLGQRMGPVIASSNVGSTKPEAAARSMKAVLEKLVEMKNPMEGTSAREGGAAA